MHIGLRGYDPIEIPDDLAVVREGKFDGTTPYVSKVVERFGRPSYVNDLLPRKLRAVQMAKEKALELGGYWSVTEPLAGIGLTARILDSGGTLHLNDFDAGCRRVLAHNFNVKPTGYDALKTGYPMADFVFLDFNDYTLKRYVSGHYRDALERGFAASSKFLLLNDCSVFYFRYGAKSYATYSELLGGAISSTPDYLRAARDFYADRYSEWRMVYAAYFRDSSFQLFTRSKRGAWLGAEEAGPDVRVSRTTSGSFL